mmetsp:Transcript_43581/g.109313  ORF Transcript_43581/g.109313 Transcript_43581/m.109313 type:complete len:265 (+) Transcript_43581:352-1146(+)
MTLMGRPCSSDWSYAATAACALSTSAGTRSPGRRARTASIAAGSRPSLSSVRCRAHSMRHTRFTCCASRSNSGAGTRHAGKSSGAQPSSIGCHARSSSPRRFPTRYSLCAILMVAVIWMRAALHESHLTSISAISACTAASSASPKGGGCPSSSGCRGPSSAPRAAASPSGAPAASEGLPKPRDTSRTRHASVLAARRSARAARHAAKASSVAERGGSTTLSSMPSATPATTPARRVPATHSVLASSSMPHSTRQKVMASSLAV